MGKPIPATQTSKKSCFRKASIYIILTLQTFTVIGIIINVTFYYTTQKDATCSDNPCQNGGTCITEGSKATCGCPPGYIGTYCQYGNPCYEHVCKNGGSCFISVGVGAVCACVNGYSGETCEIDKDQCSPNPCDNGGSCTQVGGSYRCSCIQGYLGNTCEKADPCLPNPCKHNGMCSVMDDTFQCTCHTQWAGKLCELDISVDEEPPFLELNIAIVTLAGISLFLLIVLGSFILYMYCQFKHNLSKKYYDHN